MNNSSNQMSNAVRKIHNLLSSGSVTVTGPTQPRIIKQKLAGGQVTIATSSNAATNSNSIQQQVGVNRCYVCDDPIGAGQAQYTMSEMLTTHSSTKFPNKIGQLIGEGFIVIVSVEDVVCGRCENLINYLDRLEHDMDRVRTNLVGLLHKKYGLDDDSGGGGSGSDQQLGAPPVKMQKLNSGGTTLMRITVTDENATAASSIGGGEANRLRKVVHSFSSSNVNDSVSSVKQTPSVTAVQQIKISTPVTPSTPQQSAGTQTLQRKTTKIYKCLSCDYKTSDMRLFNTHYETCKQQNFQCKNCKKIFPNFGTMKTHMVREHNTAMDNTCAVCHINFAAEASLRKHMEAHHSTNVLVTSTTTLPVGAVVASQDTAAAASLPVLGSPSASSTTLYSCSHCHFKSTDKPVFDDHMREHMKKQTPINRPKPFKCRLCAQRFETRDAATIHAKQHQPNYFKCGTCQISFPSRDQLVKHFDVHQQTSANASQQQQIAVQQAQQSPATPTNPLAKHQLQQQQHAATPQSQNVLTQKRLQESIDEALSESASAASSATDASNANIRFFSCQNCKLTFIQETYYKQHMEQHNRDSVKNAASSGSITSTSGGPSTQSLVITNSSGGGTSLAGKRNENINSSISGQQTADGNVAEPDIESIFEKMHSEKGDSTVADSSDGLKTAKTSKTAGNKDASNKNNVVITSQHTGSGELTYSISIAQAGQSNGGGKSSGIGTSNTETNEVKTENARKSPNTVGIDMPILDQPEDAKSAAESADTKDDSKLKNAPVSMPSLDDDNNEKPSHGSEQAQLENDEDAIKSEHQKPSKDIKDEKDTVKEEAQDETKGNAAEAAAASDLPEDVKADDDEKNNSADNSAVSSSEADGSGNGATGSGGEHHIAMEIDEAMQAQMESGQIKLILSDNGQLLQIDNNHIITDAHGNQILMQDPEQLQQLLQSVGVLQAADGIDGEATIQMMTDPNGQMVLVQNENNETQLIDASLLNAEGQLVIQPGQDGALGEGAHVIGEDGTRIPVSVSYTADGQPIVQVQQMHHQAVAGDGGATAVLDGKEVVAAGNEGAVVQAADAAGGGNGESAEGASANANATGGNGTYLALEDLMQQQHTASEVKTAD